jgi:hypothetical protein
MRAMGLQETQVYQVDSKACKKQRPERMQQQRVYSETERVKSVNDASEAWELGTVPIKPSAGKRAAARRTMHA